MDIVLVRDNKRVLEMDGDAGCKTIRMYLMLLNYTHLKRLKSYILCHVYFITLKKIMQITYTEEKLKTICF